MSKPTRLPTLPSPDDPNFGRRLIEVMQVLVGNRGDRLDKAVTFRDLEDKQVAEKLVTTGANGLRLGASGATTGSIGGTTLPTLAIPPSVVGGTIAGAFTRIILNWTAPKYANHAYTEVRRAAVNDISQGVIVGTTASSTYVDVVGGSYTGYYWLRHVNTSGNTGPWSAAMTATTPASHLEVVEKLTSTEWQANTSYTIFTPVAPTTEVVVGGASIRLVAVDTGTTGATEPNWATAITALGDTVVDGTVTWQAVEVGKIPFFIDPVSGLVVIDGASIREASIEALQVKDGFFDTMTAAKGTLAEANIEILNIFNALVNNYIRSDSYSPGVSGWTINKDGTAEFQDIIARGDVEASALKAGTVMVYAGNIADLQVDTIHVKDQAVTFPVYTSTSIQTDAFLADGWVTVLSSTFAVTGAPLTVIGCLSGEGRQPWETDTGGDQFFVDTWVDARVLIDGVAMSPSSLQVARRRYEGQKESANPDQGYFDMTSSPVFNSTPAVGTITVSLQVRISASGSGLSGGNISVTEASLFCLETKK